MRRYQLYKLSLSKNAEFKVIAWRAILRIYAAKRLLDGVIWFFLIPQS
jgi:hypothetical protein